MKIVSTELLAQHGNCAIIRLPERRFPGVLIQGDSLSRLVEQMRSIEQQVRSLGESELSEDINEVRELLEGVLQHYELALKAHEIDLPYTR